MLALVADDTRRGDFDVAEAADGDDPPAKPATPETATALAFAGLSVREAATRSLGC
jgi:hypothetical protein